MSTPLVWKDATLIVQVGVLKGGVYLTVTKQSLEQLAPGTALHAVTWGDSQFVMVGSCGVILTSPDGRNWTSQRSGTRLALSDVVWTGAQFIAVGGGSDKMDADRSTSPIGIILTSKDGAIWSSLSPHAWADLAQKNVINSGINKAQIEQMKSLRTETVK